MDIEQLKSSLAGILCDLRPPQGVDVVIAEPYIPFIPADWSGVLVLAEAQNLSDSEAPYTKKLTSPSTSSADRIGRLGSKLFEKELRGHLGVRPWDDGSLKLALEAIGIDHTLAAVSNAVLWSQRVRARKNRNPEKALQARSSELWHEMLKVMQPSHIVTAGKVARLVTEQALASAALTVEHTPLAHSSARQMNAVAALFNIDDLKVRFPTVREIVSRSPEPPWLKGGLKKELPLGAKIVYACHAVSRQYRPADGKRP